MNLADEYKKLIDELFSRIERLENENIKLRTLNKDLTK